ncbi:cytochrome c3 family protein [Dyella sp.]|uniref:cytochrome c3 family protein n=1 Tax=Dyella sp. TaxID=1869338 RepID=UPI002B461B43|nr:cytochrome c3 family protein [Dyella sp.]HKT27676.1 cytochrome c3 family protein [Dyella sp.]
MSQVFSPSFGLYAKLALLGLLLVVVSAGSAWRGAVTDPHRLGEPVNQPVPFSHKHHVDDDGIDCRFCHTSVETSAFAGIPPIATCMTCHSQLFTDAPMLKPLIDSWKSGVPLRWNRVYQLPDFVYFNHSIHIAKGVGCVSCHGRIDKMPLTQRVVPLSMAWCLDCHRQPQKFLRPHDKVFDLAWQPKDQKKLGVELLHQYHIDTGRMTDCSLCHR